MCSVLCSNIVYNIGRNFTSEKGIAQLKINNEKKKREITGWYEKYYRIMRTRAYEIVRDYHIADDMVSEAFIKVFNNYEEIRKLEEPQIAFYLISIIRNISIDYTRKQKR